MGRGRDNRLMEDIRSIQEEGARLPVYDDRTADEIIGYDEFGVPALRWPSIMCVCGGLLEEASSPIDYEGGASPRVFPVSKEYRAGHPKPTADFLRPSLLGPPLLHSLELNTPA